jgi:hypothetical protein
MKEVFSGTYLEAMNVRNLLENNGITVFAQNEYLSNIDPWGVAAGGLNPVKLQVDEADFDEAKKTIEDYLAGNNSL